MGPIAGTFSQPYVQPLMSPPIGGYGFGAVQPTQQLQLLQLLQIVPQQLHQVLLLQQQQIAQLQQMLQVIPAQLQQLLQIVPQQAHAFQQPLNPAISGSLGFGLVPPFTGQSAGLVM